MLKMLLSLIVIVLSSLPLYAEDVIVAKVNGAILTQKNLEEELDRLIPQITFHHGVSPEKRKNYYGNALEGIIDKELEYQYALETGIKVDKEKVEAEIEKLKKRFKTADAYKEALEKEGVTEKQVRARVEREILIQSVVTKMIYDKARVNEVDLKAYYEKNKTQFRQPDSLRIRLISTKDEKKAQDIFAKLKEGDDFGELAYNMSEDDYRVKSGDIGYIHKGRMLPEIEEAAFKLKVGDFSEPINVDDRWYIVKVEDKKPEHLLSFEKVKDKLKKEIETERAADLNKKWLADLKAKAKIEILLKTGE